MSTGMANLEEIEEMVASAREAGCEELVVLHCLSSYPAPIEQSNLLTIPDLSKRLGVQVGLSDHTVTNTASIVATSLGATLIEKHFILDKDDSSVDAFFSLDRYEFKEMVEEVHKVEKALGKTNYDPSPEAKINMRWRRSLYASKNIKRGDSFTEENIKSVRPSFGLHPKFQEVVLGRKASMDIELGDKITWEIID